jgi:hypothetical protein
MVMRPIIVLLLTVPLGAFLTWTLVQGLRWGRIKHSDSLSYFDRRREPFWFWLVAAVYLGFIGACVFLLVSVVNNA